MSRYIEKSQAARCVAAATIASLAFGGKSAASSTAVEKPYLGIASVL